MEHIFNLQTITDRQKRVLPFIVFKCCELLGKLERILPQNEVSRGGMFYSTFLSCPPPPPAPF